MREGRKKKIKEGGREKGREGRREGREKRENAKERKDVEKLFCSKYFFIQIHR